MVEPNINTVKQLVDLSKHLRDTTIQLRQLCKAATPEELRVARMFFHDEQLIPTLPEERGMPDVRPTVS